MQIYFKYSNSISLIRKTITLLLALAGKLDPKLKFNGKVTYNVNYRVCQSKLSSYRRNDRPRNLSLPARFQETLRCLRDKEANIVPDLDLDIYMKNLGLETCTDIVVGDEMLRSISDGQRKHVTTGKTGL
ncbi:ABC transporter G family member 40, partial [Mucuna pruriens]